jgi:hypothetical protein
MAMGASSVHEMLFDPLAVFIRRFLILALVSIWAWDKLLDFLEFEHAIYLFSYNIQKFQQNIKISRISEFTRNPVSRLVSYGISYTTCQVSTCEIELIAFQNLLEFLWFL